jgi:Dihydrouridine synthase (Dus)
MLTTIMKNQTAACWAAAHSAAAFVSVSRRLATRSKQCQSSFWASVTSSAHSSSSSDDTDMHPCKQRQLRDGLILPNNNSNSNNMIRTVAAPMVAASDYAFRCLVRQYSNVDLVYTQMLHARQLIDDKKGKKFCQNHLDLYEYTSSPTLLLPCQLDFLEEGLEDEENQTRTRRLPDEWQRYTTGPVMVQLAGNDVSTVVAAAQLIYEQYTTTHGDHVAGFDLNCGW